MSKLTNDNPFPFLAHADALVEKLRQDVPGALREWQVEAIHQARVATRRLKAAIELAEPVLSKQHRKSFTKTLKKLRRRLGPLRDLDVMLDHLNELTEQKGDAPALSWLKDRLEFAKQSARKADSKKMSPGRVLARLGTWWGVREEVFAAKEAIDSLLAEQLHLQLDAFADLADLLVSSSSHIKASHNESTESTAESSQTSGPQKLAVDPHVLRIAGKALRYTLEMAEVQGHQLPKKVTKSFKQMQELLGQWHDYVVLSERALTETLSALLPHHDAILAGEMLELSGGFLRRSARHLNEFSQLWSERGEELSTNIRGQFPLSRPVVSESKTDPDRAGSTRPPTPESPAAESP